MRFNSGTVNLYGGLDIEGDNPTFTFTSPDFNFAALTGTHNVRCLKTNASSLGFRFGWYAGASRSSSATFVLNGDVNRVFSLSFGGNTTCTVNLQTFSFINPSNINGTVTINNSNIISSGGNVTFLGPGNSSVTSISGRFNSVTGNPVFSFTAGSNGLALSPEATSLSNAISISVNYTPSSSPPVSFSAPSNLGVRDLTFTNTGTSTDFGFGNIINIYGNLTINAGFQGGTSNEITFRGTSGTGTITTAGQDIRTPITINCPGRTIQLGSALTSTRFEARAFIVTNGTFSTNNYNLTVDTFLCNTTNTRVVNFGTSVVTVLVDFNVTDSANLTINSSTGSEIRMSRVSGSKSFNGGGLTYPIVVQATGGQLNFNANATLRDLKRTFNGASTIAIGSGITLTFTDFTLTGVSAASRTTLTGGIVSKSSGIVSVDFLSISSQTATGGAAWYAGANSQNGGGNTGWIFSAPPSSVAFFMLLGMR
jgi:hypothetical protein